MDRTIGQPALRDVLALASRQHGVVTRAQLLARGLSRYGIKHRVLRGRLHQVARAVYAVGRPELTQYGRWMAAVLSCGPNAVLSHSSSAALWDMVGAQDGEIEVSVPPAVRRDRPGVMVHRRQLPQDEVTCHRGIPTTTPMRTLVDLAARVPPRALETAINRTDQLGLMDVEEMRVALERHRRRPGVAAVRKALDTHTFALTDSELERRFLRLVRRAGLPRPLTQQWVNGARVDFYWPKLGLVVETDGLRYHRTPAQQARDRERDQAHSASGLTPLRFTHRQVVFQQQSVRETLAAVVERLSRKAG
jgi:very-short-patch-repair endonuclease